MYGIGDTATQIISFCLLPLYARYLSTSDYGVLALLLTVEVVTKVVFRWGIDGAFMRLYYRLRGPGRTTTARQHATAVPRSRQRGVARAGAGGSGVAGAVPLSYARRTTGR